MAGEAQAAGSFSDFHELPSECPSICSTWGQSGILAGGKGEAISQLTLAGNNCFESRGLISGFHMQVSLKHLQRCLFLTWWLIPSPSAASEVSLKIPEIQSGAGAPTAPKAFPAARPTAQGGIAAWNQQAGTHRDTSVPGQAPPLPQPLYLCNTKVE